MNNVKLLKQLVIDLGLTDMEAGVYLATVESGNGTASQIAKIAGLQRVTTYEVLKRLSKLGFVRIRARAGSKIKSFIPIEIQEIKSKVEQKKEQLEKTLGSMKELGDIFHTIYKRGGIKKPEVLYFEGVDGVKTVLFDTLEKRPHEIISFSSHKWLDSTFSDKFVQEYWDMRVKYNIRARAIMPKTNKSFSYFDSNKNTRELRSVLWLPSDVFNFENEIDVYGDNVCIISLESGKEHAVIIRSKSIAKSMKDVFEILWSTMATR